MKTTLVDMCPTLGKPGGHYSHAACVGNLAFLSGQLPVNATGEKLHDKPFSVQVRQVFDNLDAVLHACQSRREELVQVRVYLVNIDQWSTFNQLFADWLGEHRPARCVVPVPGLHYGVALEIEAIANRSTSTTYKS